MYQVNDWIVYGTAGVYRVIDSDLPDPTGAEKERRYYQLQAANQKCQTYVPMDSPVRMRPVVSKAQAENIIVHISDSSVALCPEHRKHAAEKYYKELLQNSDCATIAAVVHTLSEHKRSLLQNGRHMSYTEEKYLRRGRDLIDSEFSVALGIPPEDVELFVKDHMK